MQDHSQDYESRVCLRQGECRLPPLQGVRHEAVHLRQVRRINELQDFFYHSLAHRSSRRSRQTSGGRPAQGLRPGQGTVVWQSEYNVSLWRPSQVRQAGSMPTRHHTRQCDSLPARPHCPQIPSQEALLHALPYHVGTRRDSHSHLHTHSRISTRHWRREEIPILDK